MSYRRGRRFEYEVRDLFRSKGWFVIRAAASKPIDLVCVKKGSTVLVECKYSDRPTRAELEEVRTISQNIGVTAVIAIKERYGRITLYDALSGEEFQP